VFGASSEVHLRLRFIRMHAPDMCQTCLTCSTMTRLQLRQDNMHVGRQGAMPTATPGAALRPAPRVRVHAITLFQRLGNSCGGREVNCRSTGSR
jgi:hypothetical protein